MHRRTQKNQSSCSTMYIQRITIAYETEPGQTKGSQSRVLGPHGVHEIYCIESQNTCKTLTYVCNIDNMVYLTMIHKKLYTSNLKNGTVTVYWAKHKHDPCIPSCSLKV
jgi:hypothetical protein